MKITEQHIDSLIPYEDNPRSNDAAVQGVAESIREFGFRNPIIVDADNVIISGHTRYKASRLLGLTVVPTLIASDLTAAQTRAFRIADNKTAEAATWDDTLLIQELLAVKDDFDMGAMGFAELLAQIEPEPYDDGYEEQEPTAEPIAKPGDLYQLGRHRLLCGDATQPKDYARLMDGKMADLIVTDPPYNVDYENALGEGIANDSMSDAAFVEFLSATFKAMSDVLKPGGAFYIWHADSNRYEFLQATAAAKLQIRQALVWIKNALVMGRQDYQWKHEPALYGWKDGGPHYFTDDRTKSTIIDDMPNINHLNKDQLKTLIKELKAELEAGTTVLRVDKPSRSPLHPTMKPILLIAQLIQNSSRQQETVLDVFGGSGTTLIAAEQLNRTCYMLELDPHFVDTIITRWETLTGQKAQKLN